ncbi:MAG: hypothetical protein IJT60_07245 [Clostridia bacterium]|nr:hypothetical protein [Clostridia bacterium]
MIKRSKPVMILSLILAGLMLLFFVVSCGNQGTVDPETSETGETDGNESKENPSETMKDTETEKETVDITVRPVMDKSKTYERISRTWMTSPDNQDKEILLANGGEALGNYRFADKSNFIIYQFDLTGAVDPSVSVMIGNNYKIEVSTDKKNWTKVVDWLDDHEPVLDRSNHGEYSFNPFDYSDTYGVIYVRFTDSDPSDGYGACFTQISVSYYRELTEDINIFKLSSEELDMIFDLTDAPVTQPVDKYLLASDGGLIYDPISREKANELKTYKDSECYAGEVKTKAGSVDVTVRYWIPKSVTAYEAVPIRYELSTSVATSSSIYIEATAFEDPSEEDQIYYDLNIPGRVDFEWEYLGYVNATNRTINRPRVLPKVERSKPGSQYPQYETTELIRSGSIPSAAMTWFKFAYTNTGNTVLDGDGNGTFCFEAVLYQKVGNNYIKIKTLENLYSRIFDELYPGETGEVWFTFDGATYLAAGDYRIQINGIVRNEVNEGYGRTIWGGDIYTTDNFDFKVTKEEEDTTPKPVVSVTRRAATRNRWIHKYEEFMSAYDSYLKGSSETQTGTLYLQVAPWTEQIVLKVITSSSNDDTLKGVACEVDVDTDSVKVNLNSECNAYVVLDDGSRFPAITVQSMADMRGNVQLGPDAAETIIANLERFQNAGINVINTTAAFEYDGSFGVNVANNIDACWFSLDVARELGLKVEGWISYPYDSVGNLSQASTLFNAALSGSSYGDADLAKANALNAIWQYQRWGENYWIAGENTIVLDVEDTRGWMRVDYNARHPLSSSSLQSFRLFLMYYYGGDIDALNNEWGSEYQTFQDINPEADATLDHNWWSFKTKDKTFTEWNYAVNFLDCFRTLERIHDYEMVLENLQETMPTAKINMRTEGANWLATVDPSTTNSHYRHVYYSQRRCGIIPELFAGRDVLYAASDYTTLPYTPSEVAELTASSVQNGIVPMLLPQFNRMRDIAINEKYGTNFTYEYNLSGKAVKGAYINTVVSVFEWFKATYENGGVPGLLAQDYLCDGYMTATQEKEIRFFTDKLIEALNTPEGQQWAKNFDQDTSVLPSSSGAYAYTPEYVRSLINAYNKSK